MASYLEVNNLSKSYGPRVLFENLSFHINEGDKIALIAPNGTGKTSLLKILAGIDSSDGEGSVRFLRDITVAFLEQDQTYAADQTVYDVVFEGCNEKAAIIREYEEALTSQDTARLEKAMTAMDRADAWNYEHEIREILSTLKIRNLEQPANTLSGGERKRVAIAAMLIRKAEFLVMDEPTNHLDLESIEFLEDYLSRSRCTLLMVTHDRYFLDRICNQILELSEGTLHRYPGNYSYFLEKREERIQNFKAETDKARNLLRTELDWMRRMPCARGTKAKYRIDAFYDLQERASQRIHEQTLEIQAGMTRLGKKIINCRHLHYQWEDFIGLEDFTYNFAPGEKIGLVGRNGVGKSTFLNLLVGSLEPTSGEIDRGTTLNIGYYRQEGIQFNPDQTVIDVVRDIAETVSLGDGKTLTASAFLNRFLFPPSSHYTKVEKLSGGEKRRLYLLTILMKSPNFLILDEPTNDLDIMTLNVLEEYLKDFPGSLLIVSHDRFFLDKLADHLFIFEGKGRIKDFVGTYSGYRQYVLDRQAEQRNAERLAAEKKAKAEKASAQETATQLPPKKKKLSYKEQKELEQLEKDLAALEQEKAELETRLSEGSLAGDALNQASIRIGEILELLDEKELRWLELND
ncbi:MAG: ABC-F family ATP-binding cassette domain-containing protein [Bacteroidales bacterium]|nr:ABC-F family ATP-binding cassette domain-containing protein [Bacteroidales bacterium]